MTKRTSDANETPTVELLRFDTAGANPERTTYSPGELSSETTQSRLREHCQRWAGEPTTTTVKARVRNGLDITWDGKTLTTPLANGMRTVACNDAGKAGAAIAMLTLGLAAVTTAMTGAGDRETMDA